MTRSLLIECQPIMKLSLFAASILRSAAFSTSPGPAVQINYLADRYVKAYITAFSEQAAMLGGTGSFKQPPKSKS
jgi:hypothetical protein